MSCLKWSSQQYLYPTRCEERQVFLNRDNYNKYHFLQYDGGQRFEMVVVVPVEEHRGLLLLGDALARKQTDHKNIMDKILEELQIARESDDEIELTMPEFNIKTDVNVVDNLRKVTFHSGFFLTKFQKLKLKKLKKFKTQGQFFLKTQCFVSELLFSKKL